MNARSIAQNGVENQNTLAKTTKPARKRAPTKPRNGELNSRAGCANARYAYAAPKSRRPRLWLALKPTQAFQMVVWLDMTGATDAILDCSSGSRGLSLGPEKVKTRCSIPRMSAMPALVDTNVLASVI